MQRRTFLTATAASLVSFPLVARIRAQELRALPKNVTLRGNYDNSRFVFETTGKGRVAFLGGSITEMDGYRPMVCEYLRKRFPKTEFDFVAAGISSTCSDVGAYRLQRDVLGGDEELPVDLFFVEFAVNDNQDGGFSYEHATRGMEGIIRHIRSARPNVDIVMTFFVNESLMDSYRKGEPATSIRAHRAVAERYEVSTIDLAKEIQEEIDDGKITWQEFGGVHPAPRGNRICADMIEALLERSWSRPLATATSARDLPEPLDVYSYANGRFRGFDGVDASNGFSIYVPEWSKIPGGFRQTFAGQPCLCAEKAGAETSFTFNGTAAALYVLAGPDAGTIEVKVDDRAPVKVNLFHHYSAGLHYPRAATLADALPSGEHKIVLRVLDEKDERSSGNAVRVLQICEN